jgi:hypothetical protein
MADIYALLKKDHREVEALFARFERAPAGQRAEIFLAIERALTLHAKAEEIAFYQSLERVLEDEIEHAEDEHEDIEKALKKARRALASASALLEAVAELKETVQHHVKDEETELFPKAKRAMKDARRIGAEFMLLKEELKLGFAAQTAASP